MIYKNLDTISATDLLELDLQPTPFCVETLLPHGLSILAGAPKAGKSWLVLDLCIHIAKGEPLWNLPVQQSGVLYLALEDTNARIQERVLAITDDVPACLYFATQASTLANGLCDQIQRHINDHPDTKLVVLDTFQLARGNTGDVSYASDYDDVRMLKQLADELDIAILLVHHMRKRGDSDVMNMFSGTTGLIGAADALLGLVKQERLSSDAVLHCTGRDIEDRVLTLKRNAEQPVWDVVGDSLDSTVLELPDELIALVELMRDVGSYFGSNAGLADTISQRTGWKTAPNGLKQKMNKWKNKLGAAGVHFRSHRSGGNRLIDVEYIPLAESDDSVACDDECAGGIERHRDTALYDPAFGDDDSSGASSVPTVTTVTDDSFAESLEAYAS